MLLSGGLVAADATVMLKNVTCDMKIGQTAHGGGLRRSLRSARHDHPAVDR